MLVGNLYEEFNKVCTNAKEVWVAAALVNDAGINLIRNAIPAQIMQHYLFGVNLQTSPSVLRTIYDEFGKKKIEGRICYPLSDIFHPKLYMVRNDFGLIAFVGSANLTKGGWIDNIELIVRLDDQDVCKEIKQWFEKLYSDAYPITEENILAYENFISANRTQEKLNDNALKLGMGQKGSDTLFANIDFSDRYFKKEHHLAYRESNWRDASPSANRERLNVQKRFLELHNDIYPIFRSYGIDKLKVNKQNHIVSMAYHIPDRTEQSLNAMWLSYGKSQDEIKEYHSLFPKDNPRSEEDDLQSFINHARLQIRIDLSEIGIWILFGKNNGGSIFDRDNFQKKMLDDSYRRNFFEKLTSLPEPYFISVAGVRRSVSDFIDVNDLHVFCKKDNSAYYFIIGRDYQISDIEMSEKLLPQTVLTEFKRLFPLYQIMRHYLPS